eukprot:1103070_1
METRQIRIAAQPLANPTNSLYFKRMVDLKEVTKFKGVFPQNEADVWRFGLRLRTYRTDNIGVDEAVLLKQVLEKLDGNDKIQWNLHFAGLVVEKMQTMQQLQVQFPNNEPVTEDAARKQLYKFDTLNAWLFSRFDLRVNRFKLVQYLNLNCRGR